MANTLQELNYNYDPMAQQAAMSDMFAKRGQTYQGQVDAGRTSMLAEAQIPSQLSGFAVTDAKNQGELAALPQKLDIEKTERSREQRFQLLTETRRAIDDPTLDDATRKELLGMAVDKLVKISYPEPSSLGEIKGTPGSNPAAVKAHFMQMIQSGQLDPLRASIDRSLDSLSMTRKGLEDRTTKINEKIVGNNAQMLGTHYPPSTGSGGGAQDANVFRTLSQEKNNIAKNMQSEINGDARANSLGIMIDSAGRVSSVKKSMNTDEKALYEAMKNQIESEYKQRLSQAEADYRSYGEQKGYLKPGAPAVPKDMTIGQLRSLYPGRSDDELKKAYKAKTGKDIK